MRPRFKAAGSSGQPHRLRDLVVVASGMAVGLRYCRLAQRDEQNGFPYTAAFEWRKAAELLRPFGRLAGHCWQEWERIMQLSRSLAVPFAADQPGSSRIVQPDLPVAPDTPCTVQRCRLARPAARFALSCWYRLRVSQHLRGRE